MNKESQATIVVEKTSVASIDANTCVNCGKCEDYCPVDAISEKQKSICHLCPDCTEMNAITPDEIIEMQNEGCTLSCPLGLSPQGYIGLLKDGKSKEAFDLIFDKIPLPTVCGYVCHHPCQDDCKRGKLVDSSIEIRALKRYISEKFSDYQPTPYPVFKQEQIAVIGAGPAGLTAAHLLSKKGYKVTIFEQGSEPGGMLLKGIPEFRIDKDMVRNDIGRLEKAGVKIICDVKIGHGSKVDDLLKDYDKIIVASGNQLPKILPIEGYRTEKVFYAVSLMEKVNAGQEVKLSGNGVVIGGGSVAIDTARTALRLGADKVTLICLERGDKVPAHEWELEEAKEEGIEIIEGVTPTRFVGHTAQLEGVEYAEIENLDINTFKYDKKAGTETVLPAHFAIVAIGQKSDFAWPENDNIVFAGDVVSNKCSVIDAMASGRKAALELDDEINKRHYSEYEVDREVSPGDLAYKIYPAVRMKADFPKLPKQDVNERIKNFDLVEFGFSDNDAKLETYRCLSCGYHFVDVDKCIGCGVCQKICPKGNVISMVAVSDNQEVK